MTRARRCVHSGGRAEGLGLLMPPCMRFGMRFTSVLMWCAFARFGRFAGDEGVVSPLLPLWSAIVESPRGAAMSAAGVAMLVGLVWRSFALRFGVSSLCGSGETLKILNCPLLLRFFVILAQPFK